MGFLEHLKDCATLACIASLFAIGLFIVLRSGTVSVHHDRGRLILGNLSHLVVGLAACLMFLMVVQQMVGLRVDFP